jgi:DNA-binding NtrC family response regulator
MLLCLTRADGSIKSMAELEIEIIRIVLQANDGHVTNTARALRIGRSSLYRKMKP